LLWVTRNTSSLLSGILTIKFNLCNKTLLNLEGERGRVGEWERGTVGEGERGRVGEGKF
jgi:hypothetical protein